VARPPRRGGPPPARELCEELRANLTDASAQVGGREAVRRLGPLRALAAETAAARGRSGRPAWSRGVLSAACAFAAVLLVELLGDVVGRLRRTTPGAARSAGSLTLFPGSVLEYGPPEPTGCPLEFHPGWLVLAAAAWRSRWPAAPGS
jgi:hypothetical protein